MGNFFKRLYMAARGQEPYRPYCHDDVEFKIGRYTARFDWVTYSRRRWFTRQKHSGTPRIRIKFEVPQQPNWDEMPLATHLDYKSSPVESYFEVGFLLRSAKDLRITCIGIFWTSLQSVRIVPWLLAVSLRIGNWTSWLI